VIAHGQAQKVAVAMLALPAAVVAEARRLVQAGGWFDYQAVRRETGAAAATSGAAAPVIEPERIDFVPAPSTGAELKAAGAVVVDQAADQAVAEAFAVEVAPNSAALGAGERLDETRQDTHGAAEPAVQPRQSALDF